MGSASLIEIIWTVVCLIGAGFCGALLWSAGGDVRWLRRENINGERRLLALDAVLVEAIFTVALTLFVVIGVWVMTVPPRTDDGSTSRLSIVTGAIFVAVAVLMSASAWLRHRWRDEYIRRRQRRNRDATAVAAPITVTVDTHDIDSLEITTKATEADGS